MNTGKITPDVFEKEVTKLRVQSMMEQELVDVTARKIGSYKETSPDEFMTV